MTELIVPKSGKMPIDGIFSQWLVKVGEAVKKGQSIAQIETFGQIIEIQSPAEGVLLKTMVDAGMPAATGAFLAQIGQPDEKIDKTHPETQHQKEVKNMTQTQSGKVIPVLMPQAGQSMEEGRIIAWKVKVGDVIKVGQVIFEIETDKATMEVEAIDSGRVAKIVVEEGGVAEVKTPVAYLADNDADVVAYLASSGISVQSQNEKPQHTSAPAAASAQTHKQPVSVSESGRPKASPAARKIARDSGVDLSSITSGSGPQGRILSTDVSACEKGTSEQTQTIPFSKMRKAIATNLAYSKQTIPHFYAKTTLDAAAMFNLYQATKQRFKCSLNDFVVAACARAIRQFPAFRSQYKEDHIAQSAQVNIGIAVGTDKGLTVPVVVNADKMTFEQLAAASRQVIESARAGKLEGFGLGVFTITNLGMFGLEEFSAIINPPESAILAVGCVREGVIVKDGMIKPTRLMTMTLSADHRVIDGVLGAQFMALLKEMLEKPEQLL